MITTPERHEREAGSANQHFRALLRDRPLEVFVVVSLSIPLTLILNLALQTRMMADDFCTSSIGRDAGLIEGYLIQYRTWAVQPSNVLIKNASGLLGSGSIPALAVVQFGILGAAFWYLLREIDVERRISFLWRLIGVLSALLALYLLAPKPIQSFFWLASLVHYTLPLALSAALLTLVIRQARAQTPPTAFFTGLFGLLCLIAAGFSESYLAAQTGALGAGALLSAINRRGRRELLPLFIVGIVFTGAMAVFIITAPGNIIRRASFPFSLDPIRFIIDTVIMAHALLVVMIANFSPLAIGLMIAVGFTFNQRFSIIKPVERPVWRILLVIYLTVILPFGAFASIGIYATGYPPPARTYVILAFIVLSASTALGAIASATLGRRVRERTGLRLLAGIVAAASIVSLIQSSQLLPLMTAHARAWDERDSLLWRLVQSGERDPVIPPLEVDLATLDGLETIGPDPDHWVNQCAARYYRVETIRVDETRTPEAP